MAKMPDLIINSKVEIVPIDPKALEIINKIIDQNTVILEQNKNLLSVLLNPIFKVDAENIDSAIASDLKNE